MKGIKLFIAFFTIWIGLLIIGESKVFYLQNFSDAFTNTTMYEQKGIDKEQMRTDILKAAHSHQVDFFILSSTPNGTNIQYNIYGTKNVHTYIAHNFHITNKTYKSFLLGNVSFDFTSFESAAIDELSLTTNYYVIGSSENIQAFKMALINTYAGNHPIEGSNEMNNMIIIAIWFLVGTVILMFTIYDILHQQKENLIRITMGESVHVIVLRNIIIDSSVLLLLFLISYWSLQPLTNPSYALHISLLAFTIIIILNACAYVTMYRYNLKKAFSNSRNVRGVLGFNYLIKVISIIVTTAIVSSNVIIIYEAYMVYQQKDFFEDYKEYAHVFFRYDVLPLEEEQQFHSNDDDQQQKYHLMNERENYYNYLFYQQNYYQGVDQVLQLSFEDASFDQVSMNKSMERYVKGLIPSIQNKDFTKEIYILMPHALKEDESLIEETMLSSTFYDTTTFSREVIYYDETVAFATNHTKDFYTTSYVKNPVIIFLNIDPTTIDPSVIKDTDYIDFPRMMYHVTKEQVQQFAKEQGLENQTHFYINVWENFERKWEMSKRMLYINSVFMCLILFLECIIITTIIRLEYQMNALEIAIKKTLGYRVWERNKKLIIMPVITTIIGIIGAFMGMLLYNVESWLYVLFSNFILLILEITYILFLVNKMDREQLAKILKGGNV